MTTTLDTARKLQRQIDTLKRRRAHSMARAARRYTEKIHDAIRAAPPEVIAVLEAAGVLPDDEVPGEELPPVVRPTTVQEQIALGNTSDDEYEPADAIPAALREPYQSPQVIDVGAAVKAARADELPEGHPLRTPFKPRHMKGAT